MAVRVYQGQVSPSVADTIRVSGAAFDLTGCTVRFRMRAVGSATLTVDEAATVVTAAAGTVRYDWQAGDTDAAGDYLFWWSVTLPSGNTQDTPEQLLEVSQHGGGSSPDLCTIEEVKAADRAGLGNAGTDMDDVIGQMVTEASRMIIVHTGRRFAPLDASDQVRVHEIGGWWRDRDIPVTDLAAEPTLVRVLDQDAATVVDELAATDWLSLPVNREAWEPITGVRLLPGVAGGPRCVLEVTGRFGWPVVPPDVKRACVMTVIAWLRNDRALTVQSPDQFEPGAPPQRALPLAAMDLIRPYRAPVVA